MVSLPDFDPNQPGAADPEALFNRATLGVYEMGSIFKVFTAAMALDAGVVNMSSGYDASHPIRVAKFTIRDYHAKNRWLSVPEILIYSSNIGAAKMALDVGGERQQAFLGRSACYAESQIELPERGRPMFPSTWRDINTMTIGFGHGIAVTPIQAVAAMAAMVNGGVLHKPTLLKWTDAQPPPGTQVIDPSSREKMRSLMRLVVRLRHRQERKVQGYLVGGKTGTAEKLNASGGYARHKLLSSFVAAFPMDDPRYVVFAMIDEPQGIKETYGYATGGWTAAPAVGTDHRAHRSARRHRADRRRPCRGLPDARGCTRDSAAGGHPCVFRRSLRAATARLARGSGEVDVVGLARTRATCGCRLPVRRPARGQAHDGRRFIDDALASGRGRGADRRCRCSMTSMWALPRSSWRPRRAAPSR